jgi:phage terminase large subunit-like protein
MQWTTACKDWEARIVDGRSIIPAPLFPAEADHAVTHYFNELRLVDAFGSPTFGEIARPWMKDFTAAVFGAYDPGTGRRLIREFFLLISKKNGKSCFAGGVMLTALLRNLRPSAEFLILAPTLEVANNAFHPIRDMVKADPDLLKILHVQDHLKMVTHKTTGATLKVVAADSDTVSGKKATGILVDELWLFGKRANAENMLREATGGLVSRPEGFVIYLSTQSDDPPAGVFKQKLEYFRKVRDGEIEDKRSLPIIYEFPPKMAAEKAYLNPDNFHITNPNLGASVDEEWIREKLAEAQSNGEESLRGFLAKHLNVEIGMSLRGDRWPGADFWEESVDPTLTLENILARCEVVVVGIDGGGTDDLLSLYVIGREYQPDRDIYLRSWLGWGHSWAFSDPAGGRGVLQRRQSEASKLKDFERAGELTIFTKPNDDIGGVIDIVRRIYDSGLLAGVGADPAGKSVAAIADALEMSGMLANDGTPFKMTQVSQGWQLQASIGVCERELANGRFTPAAQAIMAWAVSNAKTEPRGNAEIITKYASGKGKIDPVMAMFDAAFLISKNPEPMDVGDIEIVAV